MLALLRSDRHCSTHFCVPLPGLAADHLQHSSTGMGTPQPALVFICLHMRLPFPSFHPAPCLALAQWYWHSSGWIGNPQSSFISLGLDWCSSVTCGPPSSPSLYSFIPQKHSLSCAAPFLVPPSLSHFNISYCHSIPTLIHSQRTTHYTIVR